MITPRFTLSQDETTLTIKIRAPFCKLNDLEVSVDETEFIFCSSPYYLRLNLPGQIEENERSKSSFDADCGEFHFRYEKINANETFPDLDLITKFLCTKVHVEGERLIEVIASEGLQETPIESTDCQYGFALRGGYNFHLRDEFLQVFEIDPHQFTLEERRAKRLMSERDAFSEDHYIADLLDSEEIAEIIAFTPPFEHLRKNELEFNVDELDLIKDLKNIEYNLNEQQITYCHNGLIDIMFAYCYDQRTTFFEPTCESGWTITKLCSTFCWFEGFATATEALVAAFRRSLIFPLYRSFNLNQRVLDDLKLILNLGEVYIIKCLISIYRTFVHGGDQRYILNNLFIKDYIVYVMKWDRDVWLNVLKEIESLQITKAELGLNLLTIENALENDQLTTQMSDLCIKTPVADSDDSSEESEG